MKMENINKIKLEEIQQIALKFNSSLINSPEYGIQIKNSGGLLLLGNHYGVSNKLYLSLNPGGPGEPRFDVFPTEENGPWEIDKSNGKSVAFGWKDSETHKGIPPGTWINCSRCFGSDPLLYDWRTGSGWICDTTSAFLVPWCTKNQGTLEPLLKYTRMKEYASKLVQTMIEHHQAKVVIVTGLSCMDMLKKFLSISKETEFAMTRTQGNQKYPGEKGKGNNQYQWGKLVYDKITIFLVPHFARANNGEALKDCVLWLKNELIKLE